MVFFKYISLFPKSQLFIFHLHSTSGFSAIYLTKAWVAKDGVTRGDVRQRDGQAHHSEWRAAQVRIFATTFVLAMIVGCFTMLCRR
jgi:uncharacterized membrane protein